MFVPQLSQEQATKAENADRIASRVRPILDFVAIDVANGLGKPHAKHSPALPLASPLGQPVLGIVGKSRGVETFAVEVVRVSVFRVPSPSPNPIFNKRSLETRDFPPVFVCNDSLDVIPKLWVKCPVVYRGVILDEHSQLVDCGLDVTACLFLAAEELLGPGTIRCVATETIRL